MLALLLSRVFVHNNREKEAQRISALALSVCLVIQRCLPRTPLGFGLRVIVNEKPMFLEKTNSTVLSVLLFLHVKGQKEACTQK